MTEQQVPVNELKGKEWEEVLGDIADQQSRLTVVLPDGRALTIESRPCLKPLPELEGRIPEGWKDAVYARE